MAIELVIYYVHNLVYGWSLCHRILPAYVSTVMWRHIGAGSCELFTCTLYALYEIYNIIHSDWSYLLYIVV